MQQMDTPFYGTSIAGGKEQNVKENSTVALTCRSTLMAAGASSQQESFHHDEDKLLKQISWQKDGEVLNEKVSSLLRLIIARLLLVIF